MTLVRASGYPFEIASVVISLNSVYVIHLESCLVTLNKRERDELMYLYGSLWWHVHNQISPAVTGGTAQRQELFGGIPFPLSIPLLRIVGYCVHVPDY